MRRPRAQRSNLRERARPAPSEPVTSGRGALSPGAPLNSGAAGDLSVTGTVTTINSANLIVKDQFIYAASGSTTTDGGLIIGTASGSGTAIGWDESEKRWGVSAEDGTAQDATSLATKQFLTTVSGSTGDPSGTPSDFGNDEASRVGMMYVNTTDSTAWIYC